MKSLYPLVLGVSLAVVGSSLAAAQTEEGAPAPVPNVVQLTREFVKPGKAGAIHDNSESAFVHAMAEAKWPTHYIAMCSMTGRLRCLYVTPYDSFEAWEKDSKAVDADKTLSGAIGEALVADGDLLDSVDQAVLHYEPDLSYKADGDLSHMRYMEITEYHVRPGHGKDWSDLVKMVIANEKKAGTSAHWAMFSLMFGGSGGTYLIFSSDKSLASIDHGLAEGKKFAEAMGDEGMKKLGEMVSSTVESSTIQLFALNPKQSYPPDAWVKADPEFWGQSPAAEK
ncbi:MAG TPA: hypothetical protein VMV57_06390 [Terracidiphilus sp.]|nr:hypothetical protein [Terracidiphilus sp.]